MNNNMAAKNVFVVFASAVLVQVVYGQCSCGGSYIQPSLQVLPNQQQIEIIQPSQFQVISNAASNYINSANVGNSINLVNSANIANNINLANSANIANSINFANSANLANSLNFGNGGNYARGLTVAVPASQFNVFSGSPYYDIPSGVSVTSNNNFGGSLAVSGGLPFAGNAYFDGSVASNGQAGLSYSNGNDVILTGSGCGYGIGGTQYGGQVVSTGIPNIVSSGFNNALNSGISVFGSGVSYGSGSTCGCI